MTIVGFIWLEEIVEKIAAKHQVVTDDMDHKERKSYAR